MRLLILRIILGICGVLAPFFFPVPFVMVLAVGIAFLMPPMAFFMGGLLDVLYYTGSGIPYFTILGLVIAGIALFVRQFVKARIIS